MLSRFSTPKGRRLVPLIMAMVLAMTAGTALGGHFATAVKSYTGCLNAGTIVQVAEGNAPAKRCANNQVEVHFSGGDITAITAGTGLMGGGDNGAAALSIAPAYQLPQACATAQVAKWNGTGWGCAADDSAAYTAGTGLDLNGTEFSLEGDYQLPQGCERGEAVARVPGLSAGLDQWGCRQYAQASDTCPSGQFARATGSDGSLVCAAPSQASAGVTVYQKAHPSSWVDIPQGSLVDILSLSLPAGTYLVTATGSLADDSGTAHGDQEVSSGCDLRDGANSVLSDPVREDGNGTSGPNGPQGSIAINRAVTLSAPGVVRMICQSSGSDVIWHPHMTAVVVETLITQ